MWAFKSFEVQKVLLFSKVGAHAHATVLCASASLHKSLCPPFVSTSVPCMLGDADRSAATGGAHIGLMESIWGAVKLLGGVRLRLVAHF